MITPDGIEMLLRFAPSCSSGSPMLAVARTLKRYQGTENSKLDVLQSIGSFAALGKKAKEQKRNIDGFLIVEYFCGREHYQNIVENGTTVAVEIPAEFVPLLHTGLPLDGNLYRNGKVTLELESLIDIEQPAGEGFWVAHLAAKFWAPFSNEVKAKLLMEQAEIPGFLDSAEKLGNFDYRNCPWLLSETTKAIEEITSH